MTDDLRTRIEDVVEATIKRGTDCDYGPDCPKCLSAHVADAVIRALGLREESRPATYRAGNRVPVSHRYVTEWADDGVD